MKQYRILKSFRGSQDGICSDAFTAGAVVGLSDHLAPVAVGAGWAEAVEVEAPVEAKADQPVVENKAVEPAVENKAEEPVVETPDEAPAPAAKPKGKRKGK